MNEIAYFTSMSSITQNLAAELVEDKKWVKSFVDTNMARLTVALGVAQGYLNAMNREFAEKYPEILKRSGREQFVTWFDCEGGFFLWMDFSIFLGAHPTKEKQDEMWRDMLEEGIYIAPGSAFKTREPGWFRMVFAIEERVLALAFERIKNVFQKWLDKWE